MSILGAFETAFVKLRRKRVSKQIFACYEDEVRHGALAGLRLVAAPNTSKGVLGAKVTGLYEQVLVQHLFSLPAFSEGVFIGAADGYFALGFLLHERVQRAICFEASARGRAAIAENAVANGLTPHVDICGIADARILEQLRDLSFQPARGLIFCDIEGAEYALLSEAFLEFARGVVLVVELHDKLMEDGEALRAALLERLPKNSSYEIISSAPPDWRGIPEIEALSDNDRALVSSDGRKVLGEWLVAHLK